MSALRLGTRRSALALAQARAVARELEARGHAVELVEVSTEGDRSAAAITELGGTGVFVTALRSALLAGDVDLAVHSLKDLPTAPADGIVLAAVPVREDPRDALCCPAGKTLGELPTGSRVGTGSPRRTAQLRALGLDLEVVPMRGNVDTRLRRADEGEVDAVVLAYAGLRRLGRTEAATEVLDPLQMLPAPGQGALAIECRADDELHADLAALDDADARDATTAERTLLAALEAGCTAPVGALADIAEDEIYLRAVVASLDGATLLRHSAVGPRTAPADVARTLADELLDQGAAELTGALA